MSQSRIHSSFPTEPGVEPEVVLMTGSDGEEEAEEVECDGPAEGA